MQCRGMKNDKINSIVRVVLTHSTMCIYNMLLCVV